MTNLELIQGIGNEICEGCGPYRDCELGYDDCPRIQDAYEILEKYLVQRKALLPR